MTTPGLNIKISDIKNKTETTSLVTTTVLNTKINEVENKIPDHVKCITTEEFNKSTAENFSARLTGANLQNKTEFDGELREWKL